MTLHPPLADAVRWLLQPGRARERELLAFLAKGPRRPAEVKATLGFRHDPQVHRALDALDDFGLLDRLFDTRPGVRGPLYEASPLGVRALELADRVDAFLAEHAKPARSRKASFTAPR